MAGLLFRIQGPSFQPVLETLGLHKGDAIHCRIPSRQRGTSDHISRRPYHYVSVPSAGIDPSGMGDISPSRLGFHHQQSEVHPGSFPEVGVSGLSCGLRPSPIDPSSLQGLQHKGRVTGAIVQTHGIFEIPSSNGGPSVLVHTGNISRLSPLPCPSVSEDLSSPKGSQLFCPVYPLIRGQDRDPAVTQSYGCLEWESDLWLVSGNRDQSDASCWGARCSSVVTGGRWSREELALHINCLEFLVGSIRICSLSLEKSNCCILLQKDNLSAVRYVNRLGGTRSRLLVEIAKDFESN
ncbi:hypothetical protein NDU88_002407 [Pleurodeles waltl]|uniref:Uncharacterized protein n=1 Tax=Pleurodeles waltl TaxID=8319 RepID=A0AAV7UVH9_PLEWA|nr:hypothetical protein NDU88_002407 [Pleurodeles waltl]